MGNKSNSGKFRLLTPGSMKKAERDVMSFSGLSEDQYEIRKVTVDAEKKHHVTTIVAGDPEKQTMVLIHGYGGSGTLYYKVIKGLTENFQVIVIDLIGMGSSSRPAWTITNGTDADEYFMDIMEKWRIEMGNLTDFVLVGHSYGGYLSGTYASRYPHHIRKLLLVSPLGLRVKPAGFDQTRIRTQRGGGPGFFRVTARKLWGKVSPFSVMRMLPEGRCRKFIKGYQTRAQPVDSEAEGEALQEYLFQILLRPSSTEFALFQQFEPGLFAYKPLATPDRLFNTLIPFPISIVFGQRDWMDSRGARDIVKANKFFESGDSQLHVLPNAGHQLFMNNPQGFVDLITADVLGHVKHVFTPQRYKMFFADEDGNMIYDDEAFPENPQQEESKEGTGQNAQWVQPQFASQEIGASEAIVTLSEGGGEVEISDEELQDAEQMRQISEYIEFDVEPQEEGYTNQTNK